MWLATPRSSEKARDEPVRSGICTWLWPFSSDSRSRCLVLWCFGALYETHTVAPRTPSFYVVIRDKLRVSSPVHATQRGPVSLVRLRGSRTRRLLLEETLQEANEDALDSCQTVSFIDNLLVRIHLII